MRLCRSVEYFAASKRCIVVHTFIIRDSLKDQGLIMHGLYESLCYGYLEIIFDSLFSGSYFASVQLYKSGNF